MAFSQQKPHLGGQLFFAAYGARMNSRRVPASLTSHSILRNTGLAAVLNLPAPPITPPNRTDAAGLFPTGRASGTATTPRSGSNDNVITDAHGSHNQ
jgi:hypothetical protein